MTETPQSRTSLLMKPAIAQKLESLVAAIPGATTNSLLNAMIYDCDAENAQRVFARALAVGVVKNRGLGGEKPASRAQLLSALSQMTPEQLQEALAVARRDGTAGQP